MPWSVGYHPPPLSLQADKAPSRKPAGSLPSAATANIIIPRAVVGNERTIAIQARNAKGEPYPHGGEDVQAKITLLAKPSFLAKLTLRGSAGPPVSTKVRDNRDGTYQISFTTQQCGYHQLDITIEKQPIKGSPFAIYSRQARSYSSLSSSPLITFKSSRLPWGIAVSDSGDIYVSLYDGRIEVFNESGSKVRNIGSGGSGDGQFNTPLGIVLRGDVMYVADNGNHRIQKLTLSGTFMSKFGSQGRGDGMLSSPYGVCLDHDGRVFVADSNNSRVSVFSDDGTFLYHTGASSNELGDPGGLAFDPSGNLHVADYGLKCVKVFSPRGDYITEYGRGQLDAALYIAINEEGYSFVSDGRTLSILDPQHKRIFRTEDIGSRGVALDKDGHIYVASGTEKILKF